MPKKAVTPSSSDVEEFMRGLDHPLKPVLEAVRRTILGADARIIEGIKWNAPSFRLDEHFATTNIRNDRILVVLHFGAKVKDNTSPGFKIDDPRGLLKWLAKDRCVVTFPDTTSVRKNKLPFQAIIREWITYLN
jgi:hypothetical protein